MGDKQTQFSQKMNVLLTAISPFSSMSLQHSALQKHTEWGSCPSVEITCEKLIIWKEERYFHPKSGLSGGFLGLADTGWERSGGCKSQLLHQGWAVPLKHALKLPLLPMVLN